jgi:isopentenyl-diphosphate Delta-isomerase
VKEELVDILDETGQKTGQTMLKSETHAKSIWHSGAHIWIYNSNGDILLQLRGTGKVIRPGAWDVVVAGHIMAGEGPLETAVREAKEEIGLEVKPESLVFIEVSKVQDEMPGWTHRVFNWVYSLKTDLDINDLEMEKEEVADLAWMPLEQFESEIHDPEKSKKYWSSRIKSYEEAITAIKGQLAK